MTFDLDIDFTAPAAPTTTAPAEVTQQVTERVRVVSMDSGGYVGKEVGLWNWSDLRDFIMVEIEKVHGPQVRDPKKESGIVKGFISRWGIEKAHAIASASFKVHGGMWRNAPISITRFSKNSDPYFADLIAANL